MPVSCIKVKRETIPFHFPKRCFYIFFVLFPSSSRYMGWYVLGCLHHLSEVVWVLSTLLLTSFLLMRPGSSRWCPLFCPGSALAVLLLGEWHSKRQDLSCSAPLTHYFSFSLCHFDVCINKYFFKRGGARLRLMSLNCLPFFIKGMSCICIKIWKCSYCFWLGLPLIFS